MHPSIDHDAVFTSACRTLTQSISMTGKMLSEQPTETRHSDLDVCRLGRARTPCRPVSSRSLICTVVVARQAAARLLTMQTSGSQHARTQLLPSYSKRLLTTAPSRLALHSINFPDLAFQPYHQRHDI